MMRSGVNFDHVWNDAGIDVWLARRVLSGWRPKAIVAACGGAVSERTAYRWIRDLIGIEDVTVNGYVATFAHRRGKPPKRLSEWRRA